MQAALRRRLLTGECTCQVAESVAREGYSALPWYVVEADEVSIAAGGEGQACLALVVATYDSGHLVLCRLGDGKAVEYAFGVVVLLDPMLRL
jgi:hypothetical protein